MIRYMPFPFPDGRFPPELWAVIQRTVLEGHEPAREVIHDEENNWVVASSLGRPHLRPPHLGAYALGSAFDAGYRPGQSEGDWSGREFRRTDRKGA